MLAILGWISLTLLGGAPTPDGPEGLVRVEVRLMEMKGVSWRGAAFHELTPQGLHGAASVWISNKAGLKILSEQAHEVVRCPLAVTDEGASSQIRSETQHNYVAHLKRVADGPPGENTAVAYEPVIGTINDGVTAEFSCRAVAGGTLVKVTVDDSRLLGFDTVNVADSVTNPKTKKKSQLLNVHVQVPELTTCHVAGEWLVPRGGALVVGFGAKSIVTGKARSSGRERVVVIEPEILKTKDVVRDSMVIAGVHIPMEGFEPRPGDRVEPARYTRPKPVAPKSIAAARPIPISPTVLPLLASPTLAPRGGWKATVRLEARTTPPTRTDENVVTAMCLPLSAAPLPIRLANVWLSASIEPRRDESAGLRMATPPTRGLPTPITIDGQVVDLPPLPDDFVQLASTSQPTPTPQTLLAAVAARPLDARLDGLLDQFLAKRHATLNQIACEEVVLYPAPNQDHLIPFRTDGMVTAVPLASDKIAAAKVRLQRLKYFQSAPPAVVVRDLSPAATTAEGTKIDADFLRTYYAHLFRSSDGNANVIERQPAHIDPPTAEKATVRGATLGLQLKTADGECEFDSGISLKAIEAQPVTVRIPMADGTIVEIQAKVVKSAKK